MWTKKSRCRLNETPEIIVYSPRFVFAYQSYYTNCRKSGLNSLIFTYFGESD
jgi:hypothetical protein